MQVQDLHPLTLGLCTRLHLACSSGVNSSTARLDQHQLNWICYMALAPASAQLGRAHPPAPVHGSQPPSPQSWHSPKPCVAPQPQIFICTLKSLFLSWGLPKIWSCVIWDKIWVCIFLSSSPSPTSPFFSFYPTVHLTFLGFSRPQSLISANTQHFMNQHALSHDISNESQESPLSNKELY